MTNPPADLLDFVLLEALPGYTRAELDKEPAESVMHWLIILEERAREEKKQMDEANRG